MKKYRASVSRRTRTFPRRSRRMNESIQSEDWFLDYEDAVYKEATDVKSAIQGRIDTYVGQLNGMRLGTITIDDFGAPAESWGRGQYEPAEVSMELFVPDSAEPELLSDGGYSAGGDVVQTLTYALDDHFSDYFDMWAAGLIGVYYETTVSGGDRFTLTYNLGETDFTLEDWYEANMEDYEDDDMYESRRRPVRKPAVHARPRSRRRRLW